MDGEAEGFYRILFFVQETKIMLQKLIQPIYDEGIPLRSSSYLPLRKRSRSLPQSHTVFVGFRLSIKCDHATGPRGGYTLLQTL